MYRRFGFPTKILVSVGILIASSAVFGAVAASAAPGPASSVDKGGSSPDILAKIQNLRDLAVADPTRYAGVSTQGADRVTVHLVDGIEPSAATQRVAADLSAQGVGVAFDHQKRSIRELTAISEGIPGARPFASLGSKLQSWGVNPDTNSVEVGVTITVTPQLLAEVRTIYGDAVTVVQKPVAITALNRLSDISPFYGGDRIFGPGGSYCTSGFTVTNFYGEKYAIAAAHCWQNGTAVTTSGINVTDPHIPFGTVNFNGFQDGGNIDAELIGGGGYAGRLWIGDVFSAVSQPATSVRNSCTGCVVYFDGSLTGQTVLATLIGSPYTAYFCDINGNNCHNGVATQEVQASSRICRGGDSGGPVEVQDGSGGIIAVGVIRACTADGLHGWYTQLPPVLSHWVSTLTLG